jgi:hypothetical protein
LLSFKPKVHLQFVIVDMVMQIKIS